VPHETNEKSYLRNAFISGALLIAAPLAFGAFQGFPKEFYVFTVPSLAGLLVIVYALENSIRHLRVRLEILEDDAKNMPPPAAGGGFQAPR
jgi:hypothetical protein